MKTKKLVLIGKILGAGALVASLGGCAQIEEKKVFYQRLGEWKCSVRDYAIKHNGKIILPEEDIPFPVIPYENGCCVERAVP